MSIFKCPINCEEHDYMFSHSLITCTRVIKHVPVVVELIICRECGHWISNRTVACSCRFRCHEEADGTIVMSG
jgi:hypothetical protein